MLTSTHSAWCGPSRRWKENHPAITSLHRATYGMVLFAILHKGLVMDDIQQMLAGDKSHPREQLLQQISSKSDLLIHQLADFKNLIRDRKVVSFYETEQTRRLVLVRIGLHLTQAMICIDDRDRTRKADGGNAPGILSRRLAQTRLFSIFPTT